jgi:UDPglucose--hexose-1-phosphate uridylyltransferase
MTRPWQGQTEHIPQPSALPYDPTCYLCPGNTRAGGTRNPEYKDVFAFQNDFSALLPNDIPAEEFSGVNGVIKAQTEKGICRVLCYSPRHDLTLADMDISAIGRVIQLT